MAFVFFGRPEAKSIIRFRIYVVHTLLGSSPDLGKTQLLLPWVGILKHPVNNLDHLSCLHGDPLPLSSVRKSCLSFCQASPGSRAFLTPLPGTCQEYRQGTRVSVLAFLAAFIHVDSPVPALPPATAHSIKPSSLHNMETDLVLGWASLPCSVSISGKARDLEACFRLFHLCFSPSCSCLALIIHSVSPSRPS